MSEPIQFEAIKTSLKQSKDGYILTLAVHPDDLPDDLMRDFIGSRYVVVMDVSYTHLTLPTKRIV